MKTILTLSLCSLLACTVQASTSQIVQNDHYGGTTVQIDQNYQEQKTSISLTLSESVITVVSHDLFVVKENIAVKNYSAMIPGNYNQKVYWKNVPRCYSSEKFKLNNIKKFFVTSIVLYPKINSKAYCYSNL